MLGNYDKTTIESIQSREIMLVSEIGQGPISKLFKGRWRNMDVVVKRFKNNAARNSQYIDKCHAALIESSTLLPKYKADKE